MDVCNPQYKVALRLLSARQIDQLLRRLLRNPLISLSWSLEPPSRATTFIEWLMMTTRPCLMVFRIRPYIIRGQLWRILFANILHSQFAVVWRCQLSITCSQGEGGRHGVWFQADSYTYSLNNRE